MDLGGHRNDARPFVYMIDFYADKKLLSALIVALVLVILLILLVLLVLLILLVLVVLVVHSFRLL